MNEKELEMAEALEQAQRDASIARAAKLSAPEQHDEFDGVHCVECWEELPQARLAWGRIRCVHCQTQLEKLNAHKA